MTEQPAQPARPSSFGGFGSNANAQQPAQPARPSPFARLGGNAQQPAPGASQPAQQPTPAPRPNPLTSRLGPPKTQWRIIPLVSPLVRFDLTGLGDPFHRMLGTKLSVEMGETPAAIKAMEAGGEQVAEMAARLDESWKEYDFKGALLLYNWNKDTRSVLMGRIPLAENTEPEDYEDDKRPAPTILRVLDLWLVINVLARTRANLLLPDAPLALEAQYLGRSLYSNDPRLLALAQATGCIEESALS